jgi:hypothetical protein
VNPVAAASSFCAIDSFGFFLLLSVAAAATAAVAGRPDSDRRFAEHTELRRQQWYW